jgi:hypothetical protein
MFYLHSDHDPGLMEMVELVGTLPAQEVLEEGANLDRNREIIAHSDHHYLLNKRSHTLYLRMSGSDMGSCSV